LAYVDEEDSLLTDSAMAQSSSSSSSKTVCSGLGRRRRLSRNSTLGAACRGDDDDNSGYGLRLSSQGRFGHEGNAHEYPSVLERGEEIPDLVLLKSGMIGVMMLDIVNGSCAVESESVGI